MAETPDSGYSARTSQEDAVGQPKLVDTLTVRRFINKTRSVIYGTMLGDSYIMSRGTGSALRVLHAEDQKDLVMHKYEIFRKVAPTPPRSFPHEKWGQPKWYFWTACDVEWQKVWSIFHQNCRTYRWNGQNVRYKVVTKQILKEVDDLGLAMWIMDDGSYTYGHQDLPPYQPMNVFRLHTNGYTYDENLLIVRWLKDRYDVSATILNVTGKLKSGALRQYHVIRIGWREFEKITKRVKRFVIPSMQHKIGAGPLQDKRQLETIELKTRSELHGNVQSCQK